MQQLSADTPHSPNYASARELNSPAGHPISFANQGMVDISNDASVEGIFITSSASLASFANDAGAQFKVVSTNDSAVGYDSNDDPGNITNAGNFDVTALNSATGVNSGGTGINLVNTAKGVISVTSRAGDATGVISYNFGTNITAGGTLTNSTFDNQGTITVNGVTSATGVEIDNFDDASVISNEGIITATATGEGAQSVGIALSGLYNAALAGASNVRTITNAGTITAQIAILAFNAGDSPPQYPSLDIINNGSINGSIMLAQGHQQIENSGTIVGDITLGNVNDPVEYTAETGSIVNSGHITGDILLYDGSDTLDLTKGTLTGTINIAPTTAGKAIIDKIATGVGPNLISIHAGDSSLSVTVTGEAGGDTTVQLDIASTSASLVHQVNGTWVVNAGADGTVTLIGVQTLQFTDKSLALNPVAQALPAIVAPVSVSVQPGTATAIAGLSIDEYGATAAETFVVSASDTSGVLTATGPGITGTGTTELTIKGTLAQVNAVLATLTDTVSSATTDMLNLSVTDSLGGSDSTNLTIAPDLAAPVITLTTGGQVLTIAQGQTFNLSGTGSDTVLGAGGTINFRNVGGTVTGNNDIVSVDASDVTLAVTGFGDTVSQVGADDTIAIGGNGQNSASDYVTFASGGVLNEAAGTNLNAFGSGVTVYANGTDNLGLYGASDTANINGTGSEVWTGGNGQNGASDYVNFASGGVLNEAAGSSINAYGNGVTVYANGTDNLGLYGASDTANINGTGSEVWTGGNGQNGASDYVTFTNGGVLNEASGTNVNAFGSGVTIDANGSDNLGVYGANDTAMIGGSGSQVWIGGNGQNGASDYVTYAHGGVLNEAAGTNLNAFGSGVAVYANGSDNLGLYGANDTAMINGTGSQVWTGGNGQNGTSDYVTFANGGMVNEASGANLNTFGSGVTVNASGSDNLGLYGANDTANISGTGSQVWTGGNGQNGTADYFHFANGGAVNEAANASINAYGNGITVNANASDNLGIYGTGDTVKLGANDGIWAGKGSDVFVLPATTGQDVITGFVASGSNHDTLQFSRSVFADWAHLLGATKQQGSDLLITIDANDTVVVKNVTLASFTSADAKFV